MRYLKMLGLAIVVAAILMAFAGSTSATTLTSPAGTTLGTGTKLKATAETNIVTQGVFGYSCPESTLEGTVANGGGASATVTVSLTSVTFAKCGLNLTVAVIKPGSLEIHTDSESADGNGKVTWTGAEITFLTHSIAGTMHCIYYTNNTPFGTVTGSKNRSIFEGKTATLQVESSVVPTIETDIGCAYEHSPPGVQAFTWSGSYTFETPDYLDID